MEIYEICEIDYTEGRDGDPDGFSDKLQEAQLKIYNRDKLKQYNLEKGKLEDDYLYIHLNGKKLRFGSDTIPQLYDTWSWIYFIKDVVQKSKKYIEEKEHKNYEECIRYFKHKTQRIGGHIIFPKEISINTKRNSLTEIRDRFDLTLECIRRYYLLINENKRLTNPLEEKTGCLSGNEEFFKLFGDFKGYVDFFYLKSLVHDDYSGIKCFIQRNTKELADGGFPQEGFPLDQKEWYELYEEQIRFVENRTKDILSNNTLSD